ncbi:MAG: polysaccharide deacetylase family protein, partial [Isosphaeraceae bacterium]
MPPRQVFLTGCLFLLAMSGCSLTTAAPPDGNRLAYLDEVNPYYPHRGFPKLTTPQWVGEPGVEAVVVLAIDDMREPARYEAYLRPILNRLKAIDGRAPVSIMTNQVKPDDPQLQSWLKEGLSLEIHTLTHPCPLLAKGDFAEAARTYHGCVDLMNKVPGNTPVAFRMPCCDSMNTVSPRFFAEIFNKTSPGGKFLSIDSSVFTVLTPDDPSLPRELVFDSDGKERFRKYIPFPSFVNTIENYPYPYVIGRLCWVFPCIVPSDWEAQSLQMPNNPKTVEDLKAALDCV